MVGVGRQQRGGPGLLAELAAREEPAGLALGQSGSEAMLASGRVSGAGLGWETVVRWQRCRRRMKVDI